MTSSEESPEWLNRDLVESALRYGKGNPSLEVTNFQVILASGKGDNFASQIFRVKLEMKTDNASSIKCSYLFKSLGEGDQAFYVLENGMWGREVVFYNEILPLMAPLLDKEKPLTPRGFYFKSSEGLELIIMEDLMPDGFKLANRMMGMDLDHSLLVMKSLGRFHAASVVIAEQNPQIFDQFKVHLFYTEHFRNLFSSLMRSLSLELEDWPKHKHLKTKLEKLSNRILELGSQVTQQKPGEFLVLNHGDIWTSNILFKYNNKLEDLILIDFQLVYYGSPVIDMINFFNTSLQDEIREKKLDLLVETYHQSLVENLNKLGYTKSPPTKDYFVQQFREKAIINCFVTCSDFAIARAHPEDNFIFEDHAYKTGTFKRDKIFARETTVKEIKKRLTEFEVMGLFDQID